MNRSGSRPLLAAAMGFGAIIMAHAAAPSGLPLEAGRRVDLHTNEGSWISLDVSPDGRALAFDLLGDLYLLPVEGGRARQLTSGLAFDSQPRFSPDGRRILFVSDRSGGDNLWTMASDGSDLRQVTQGNDQTYISPEWTPDGRYAVVSTTLDATRDAKPQIFSVNGGTGTALIKESSETGGAALKLLGAAFGPDARRVWFARRQDETQLAMFRSSYQLATYDRETNELTAVSSRYGGAFRPALSPDGKWLAYGTRHDSNTGLLLRELRTGNERWLAYPIQHDAQEVDRPTLDLLPGFAFTPDSTAVVLSYGGRIWRVPVAGGAPTAIPFTVDAQVPVGPGTRFEYRVDDGAELTVTQIRDAVPSPDKRRLAFTALNELYVMDWPNGRPQRLAAKVSGGKFNPSWSPDGRSLAFVTWQDREGGNVWRVSVDRHGDPRRLSDVAGYYQQTAWSPAGDRIVALRSDARSLQEGVSFDYYSGPGLAAEFVWVPAAGGAVTSIVSAGDRAYPHFAGAADRIFAYSASQGLLSFRWDGSDVRAHLKKAAAGRRGFSVWSGFSPVEFMLMAPDRQRALIQVGANTYVVPVPFAGAETPTFSITAPETSALPVRRLTEVGGQFPAWSADGHQVHWSLGNAHFVCELPPGGAAAPGCRASERRIEIRVPRDVPHGSAVLRGARVITMRGDEIVDNADVVIRDQRIAAIGPQGRVALAGGAKVIDVSGKTIVPGFVDTHFHSRLTHGRVLPPIHTSEVWQFPITLAYGVTTTRDPSGGGGTTDLLTYQDRVETGDLIGPRIFSTGPPIFQADRIQSFEHAKEVLRRYSDYYRTKTLKMYMAGNRQQRQWIVMAARALQLTPTVEGGGDYKLNITHALDGFAGLEHTLPVFPLYADIVGLFKTSEILYSPTLLINYGGLPAEDWFFATENVHDDAKLRRFTPHANLDNKAQRRNPYSLTGWAMRSEYVFDRYARFAKDVIEAGGRIGIGSHSELHGLGYHWELRAVQSGGMSTRDTLRAATLLGAQGIGLAQDLGSIEPGKLADLVVLDADPLTDIRNTREIRYVMKNGRLYEGETLNEVYPRTRPFERHYQWEKEPSEVH